MKIICIIESNYVVNRKVVNDDYMPTDNEVEDTTHSAGIGDWYEESEGIFYRPINAVPPDSPIQPE
jgi:hypothetical protein